MNGTLCLPNSFPADSAKEVLLLCSDACFMSKTRDYETAEDERETNNNTVLKIITIYDELN